MRPLCEDKKKLVFSGANAYDGHDLENPMLMNTPACKTGWTAPDFTLEDPDGRAFTMSTHTGKGGLLVAFICNHCPYVQAIAARLAADAADLAGEGIPVLAIMSNDYHAYPEDSPAGMTAFSKKYGFGFPYLVDEDQRVARSFGAVCTPDFFGLDSAGKLQYRGRLDDAGMHEKTGRSRELFTAMCRIARTGTGPAVQKASMGCSIKWRDNPPV